MGYFNGWDCIQVIDCSECIYNNMSVCLQNHINTNLFRIHLAKKIIIEQWYKNNNEDIINERIHPQGDPDGGYVGSAFKNAIFSADTSRPVTANSEDTPGDTLTKVMDVNAFSYNYGEVCGGRDVRVGRCVWEEGLVVLFVVMFAFVYFYFWQ